MELITQEPWEPRQSVKANADALHQTARVELVGYFLNEQEGEEWNTPAAFLRWVSLPVAFRDDDERTLNDLSVKLQVTKAVLLDCMKSKRFKRETKTLLDNGGIDDLMLDMIRDTMVEKALEGNVSAATLVLKMAGKMDGKQTTKAKDLTELSDADLKALIGS